MIQNSEVMIHAARLGNIEVLRELISQHTDVNTRDSKGYTALIIACYNNKLAAAKLLLEAGADVNAKYGDYTVLMDAAESGYSETVKMLISAGADVNAKDRKGRRPVRQSHGRCTLGKRRMHDGKGIALERRQQDTENE